MDISAAYGRKAELNDDLLGMVSPSKHTNGENPFNTSRQNGSGDISTSPHTPHKQKNPRPTPSRSNTGGGRMSHDIPRVAWHSPTRERKPRRFSFGVRRGTSFDDGLDEDGDLGYAAASDQEGSRRKVIVERMEMVKSKMPVFAWC